MSRVKLCDCGALYEGLDLYHPEELAVYDDGTSELAARFPDIGFLMTIYLKCRKCGRGSFSPDTGAEPDAESVTLKLEAFPELEITVTKKENQYELSHL